MSGDESLDLRRDRRSWLKMSAATLAAAMFPMPVVSTPTWKQLPDAAGLGGESEGRFFTSTQYTLVEELAETIVPANSHSGGAKAAKVADYIDQIVGISTNEAERALWNEGLRLIDLMSQRRMERPLATLARRKGSRFLRCSPIMPT